MTPAEVTALVDGFVREQAAGKWDYRLGPPEKGRDEWRVRVRWIPRGGGVFDTEPAIVLVCETKRTTRWLDEDEKVGSRVVKLMDS
jgi:hypothetical protein